MASELANYLLRNGWNFLDHIRSGEAFEMSDVTNAHIIKQIKYHRVSVKTNLIMWKPWNRWFSRAHAMFDRRYPNDINLNIYKLKHKSIESIAGTLIHEYIHQVDHYDQKGSYGHGNNSPVGKEKTAPYYIGRYAKELLTRMDAVNGFLHKMQ